MAGHKADGGWPGFVVQAPEAWLGNLQAIAEASQAFAASWFKNRSAQLQSNLEAWTRMAGCKDPSEIAAIQQRWLQDSIERLSAEAKDCQVQIMRLTQRGSAAPDSSASAAQAPRSSSKVA